MAHVELEDHNNGNRSHVLVVAYSMQGHINPARTFARRLAHINNCNAIGISVSLSIPICGHRCLFPSIKTSDEEVHDGVISYIPYSDGKDDGSWSKNPEERRWRFRESSKSLSAVIGRLKASGRPVMRMVCTFCMPWVVEVAREHKIPLAVLWIQPAAALVTYYHYFHGHDEIITPHITDPAYEVSLPGLNPLRICDMPTFFVDKMHNVQHKMFLKGFRDFFEQMDQDKPLVMVNTFSALEHSAIEAIKPHMDVVAIGPAVTLLGARQLQEEAAAGEAQIHLFKEDGKNYEGWLDRQVNKSVVYVSFGSLATYTKQQVEEILHGLRESGRPYLWVVRKEGRTEDVDLFLGNIEGDNGMVVEWCNQLHVLSHPSIGCFVTHCGWNSILEALLSGVPMVAVPTWSDQPLSACLVEKEWSVGIRAKCNKEGVLTSAELVKSMELLMGNSEMATKIKENTSNLKKRAQEAIATDGLSDRNLRSFIERVQHV